MGATFRRIVIAAIALIAAAGIASALVISGASSAPSFDGARNSVVNTVIDASGIKGRIDAELRAKAGTIAERAGISQAVVDNVVDSLAISEWRAASLPADALETGTYDLRTDSLAAQVTTYDDPAYVTVDAYGQAVTMEVPASARPYLAFIKFAEYLD